MRYLLKLFPAEEECVGTCLCDPQSTARFVAIHSRKWRLLGLGSWKLIRLVELCRGCQSLRTENWIPTLRAFLPHWGIHIRVEAPSTVLEGYGQAQGMTQHWGIWAKVKQSSEGASDIDSTHKIISDAPNWVNEMNLKTGYRVLLCNLHTHNTSLQK